jgi:phosphoribosylformylglycinamidine synthase
VQENNSVMLLSTLAGSTLGVWVSHGEEGRNSIYLNEENYNIVSKYAYEVILQTLTDQITIR